MNLATKPGLSKAERQRVRQLADHFEKSWQAVTDASRAPDLETFIPPSEDSVRDASLHELIPIDLAKRWQRRQPTYLEDYLKKFPTLASTPELLAQLLFAEYRVRQEHGDKPDPSQYQARFPEQFAQLQRLIEDQCFQTMAPSPAATREDVPLLGRPVLTQGPGQVFSGGQAGARDPNGSARSAISGETKGLLPVEGYRLLKRIGSGSYGEVWRAAAPGDVEVAIKIISRPIDHAEAQRELQALELIKRLRHPYLVHTQAYWPLEDRLYIVMELADGSLSGRLKECRAAGLPGIPERELVGYFHEAAEALDYLNSQHVQHRDIKPDNILLLQRHAKVADFGMARLQEGGVRMVNATACGTPAYMAPEVWEGKISPQSDQYSLAMTYIELRLGRPPFAATDMVQIMLSHLKEQPDLGSLEEAERQVILKAVAKEPDQRYPNCCAFVDALDRALFKELQAPSGLAETKPERRRLLGWRWLLATGVLLPLVAFPVYRVAFPPERRSAVTLPAGAEKLEDGIVTDLNGRRYFKRIACRLPGDTEPIEFVLVPKEARDDPDTFYIMKNKVSVGLYRKFTSAHPEKITQKKWNPQQLGDEYPALGVGVEDAYHFAEWVHGNLPTTKEWDKAAGFYRPERGEGPYKGAWGSGSKLKIAVDRPKPMPVGRAADDESPYGCRDMAGNGSEWTGSVASSDQRVPIANPERQYVWLRGQGYDAPDPLRYKDLEEAGSKKLISLPYRDTDFDVGFRVVIEP